MRTITSFARIHLHKGAVDMRKSIAGLAQIVEGAMKLSPYEERLFVFCGRRKDRVKILYWDKSGFALWYKVLEREKYKWPKLGDDVIELTPEQLGWMLDGFDIARMRPHATLSFAAVS